jgi:hypothetical protein
LFKPDIRISRSTDVSKSIADAGKRVRVDERLHQILEAVFVGGRWCGKGTGEDLI